MKKSLAFLAISAIIVLLAGLAFARAGGKKPIYDSDSSANGGLTVGNPVTPGDTLLEVGNSASDSSTSSDGDDSMEPSTANSSSHPLSVLGMAIGPSSDCSATGTEQGGVQSDSDSDALFNGEVPVVGGSAALLSSSCRARAVKDNNGKGTSSTAILDANMGDPADLGSDTTVGVLESSSSSQTTSGSAKGESEVTAAEASAAGAEATAVHCESQTVANRGKPEGETTSSGTVLSVNAAGESQEVAGGCTDPTGTGFIDPLADSDATHSGG